VPTTLVEHLVGRRPQNLARRAGRIEADLVVSQLTSLASAWTLNSSARSNGLPAMFCATSHVSARLMNLTAAAA
jgi:hypothetical protein